MLATLTYLLRQSLSLLCSLTLAYFFITEKDGKDRKKQKFARYAHLLASSVAIFIMLAGARHLFHYRKGQKKQAFGNANDNVNLNANDNYNVNYNLNDNVNYNLTGFDLNTFSIYEG